MTTKTRGCARFLFRENHILLLDVGRRDSWGAGGGQVLCVGLSLNQAWYQIKWQSWRPILRTTAPGQKTLLYSLSKDQATAVYSELQELLKRRI